MEALATELGVPVEVLLHGLPQHLRHASDGVIIRRSARLCCYADYLRVRDPQLSMDVLWPGEATQRVRAHVLPYMALKDASDTYLAIREEAGPPTSHHREIIINNPDVLLAKYLAYRSVIDQVDLLDTVSEAVEAALTVRLQAQFQACVADQQIALSNLRDNAWRLVLHYLNDGNLLEAKQYIGACFPNISHMIDDNPGIAYQAYEYILNALQDKFHGQEHDLSIDIENYLACLASFRLMYMKATNLGFIITLVESFVSDMARKRDYLMGRLKVPTLIGAAFPN